jgi:hypothetical protein
VYFRRRTSNGGLQFGFKDGGQVIVPVLLEFTGYNWVLFGHFVRQHINTTIGETACLQLALKISLYFKIFAFRI